MFAYCLNDPVGRIDVVGSKSIWWILFQWMQFGFIHWAVEQHIALVYTVQTEVWLDGKKGRADIYDPKTGYVWEIKHGHHNEMVAQAQAQGYVGQKTAKSKSLVKDLGPAGAFNGSFDITVLETSYHVEYTTPQSGVVIYSVRETQPQTQAQFGLIKTSTGTQREQYYAYGGKYDLVVASASAVLLSVGLGLSGGCGSGMVSSCYSMTGWWTRMFR